MKTVRLLLIIGLLLSLILSSCQMEKRVYMSGYNLNWKKNKQQDGKTELASNKKITALKSVDTTNLLNTPISAADKTITAAADNNLVIIPKEKPITFHNAEPIKKKSSVIGTKKHFRKGFRNLIINKPIAALNDNEQKLNERLCWAF